MDKDVFSNGYLEIHDNTLKFKDNVIQLRNVESISIAPIDPKPIPQWAILCIIAGIIGFAINIVVGFLLIGVGAGYVAYVKSENNRPGYFLRIELNSGKSFYFDAKNKAFLDNIMNVMGNCFNKSTQQITIDMKNSKIDNMQVGDGNILNR